MNHSSICGWLAVMLLVATAGTVAADVESLRGTRGLDESSMEPVIQRWQDDQEPIARDYVQQPPLIPHPIDSYPIDLRSNKCLTCHSWTTYRKAGATKISQTHFADREENVLANVAARRYFCTQCHVPQTSAEPLIENTFEPVQSIKQ